MHFRFKQAVHLNGKDYARGVHAVPDAVLDNKFFVKLLNAGLILDAEPAHAVSAETLPERQKRLAEKLTAKAKKPAAPESAVLAHTPPFEDQALPAVPDSSSEVFGEEETAQTELADAPVNDEAEAESEVPHEKHHSKKHKHKR